ncbi:major royal jelly protein-domain-containing protein [Schizophyllum commune]
MLLSASLIASFASCASGVNFELVDGQPGLIDNGTYGPPIEIVHLFQHPPTAITVSSTGRAFVSFNRGNLISNPQTLAEIVNSTTDVAWPSEEYNTPPDGLFNASSGVTHGSSDSEHLLNVQAAVFDALDRLWVLDTGRPASDSGDNALGFPGGPKLVGFNLDSNSSSTANATSNDLTGASSETAPFTTITFPETVLPAHGFLNDIRIDLSKGDAGFAYIADSGALGLIVADLASGESWRHLDGLSSVRPKSGFLPSVFGIPTYQASGGSPFYRYPAPTGGGSDGFTLSADGEYAYFTPIASRDLYRVPTELLRVNPQHDRSAVIKAASSVQYLGEVGGEADGLKTDDTGKLYLTSPEHNAINIYSPETGLIEPFVRDPRIAWPDTLAVGYDGYLYVTLPQYWLGPTLQNGTDKRVPPFALARVPIEGKPAKLV